MCNNSYNELSCKIDSKMEIFFMYAAGETFFLLNARCIFYICNVNQSFSSNRIILMKRHERIGNKRHTHLTILFASIVFDLKPKERVRKLYCFSNDGTRFSYTKTMLNRVCIFFVLFNCTFGCVLSFYTNCNHFHIELI